MLRIALLALVLSLGPSVAAQTTPEDAAAQLMDAVKDADFERAATLMHPDALGSLKRLVMDIASVDSSGTFAAMFIGETDPAVIAALPPMDVFVHFIGAVFGIQPEMGEALRNLEAEAVGHVVEGDSLAHVVMRNRTAMMGMTISKTEVVTVKRYRGEWRALLSGDLDNFAQAMRAQFGSGEDDE